jgi:hypothetical protein
MQLKFKIPLIFFSALFIVISALVVFIFVKSSELQEESNLHKDPRVGIMIEAGKNKAQIVGGFMTARAEELKSLGNLLDAGRHLNDKEKMDILHKHMYDLLIDDSESKLISDIYVFFERGSFFSAEATKEGHYFNIDYFRPEAGGLKLSDVPSDTVSDDDDWYLVPKKTGKVHLTEPYKWKYADEEAERLMITISYPVFFDGVFAGAIGMDMELAALQRVFFDNLFDKETGAYLTLISHEGLRVAHPNEKMWLTEVGGDLPKDEQDVLKESIRSRKEYSMITDKKKKKKKSIVSFTPFKPEWLDLPWSVSMVVPLELKVEDIENYPLWILQRQLPHHAEQPSE